MVSEENKVLKNKFSSIENFESELKILKEITAQQNEYILSLEVEVEKLKVYKSESKVILDSKDLEITKTKDLLDVKTKEE